VRPPSKPRRQPRPPNVEQTALIFEAAWQASAEWGLYIWLSAVLGARRGEVVALLWEDIDLVAGMVRLDENYVRTAGGMLLKDTKTMRRGVDRRSDCGAAPTAREDWVPRLALLVCP